MRNNQVKRKMTSEQTSSNELSEENGDIDVGVKSSSILSESFDIETSKKIRRAGRKGSLVFTTNGMYGLGTSSSSIVKNVKPLSDDVSESVVSIETVNEETNTPKVVDDVSKPVEGSIDAVVTKEPTNESKKIQQKVQRGGRKGSIMFTTNGMYGLGTSTNSIVKNVKSSADTVESLDNANGDVDDLEGVCEPGKAYDDAIIVEKSTDDAVVTIDPTNGSKKIDKKVQRGGRKGSIMFTTDGMYGLGTSTNSIVKNVKSSSDTVDFIDNANGDVDGLEGVCEPGEADDDAIVVKKSTDDAFVTKESTNESKKIDKKVQRGGRKGSIMFTTDGMYGLGTSTNSIVKNVKSLGEIVSEPVDSVVNTNVDAETPKGANDALQLGEGDANGSVLNEKTISMDKDGTILNKESDVKVKTKPKRSARKGSLAFTPKGSFGLQSGLNGKSESSVDVINYEEPEINAVVYSTQRKSMDTTKSYDTETTVNSDLLVDFPPNDECDDRVEYYKKLELQDQEDEALALKAKLEASVEIHDDTVVNKTASGDSYIAALLKAEMENNLGEIEKLHRRGSCYVRSDMVAFKDRSPEEEEEDAKARANSNIPGTKDYRPYVGGFAAAAYEAAKGHHFLKDV